MVGVIEILLSVQWLAFIKESIHLVMELEYVCLVTISTFDYYNNKF